MKTRKGSKQNAPKFSKLQYLGTADPISADTKVHVTLRLGADIYRKILAKKREWNDRTVTSTIERILSKQLQAADWQSLSSALSPEPDVLHKVALRANSLLKGYLDDQERLELGPDIDQDDRERERPIDTALKFALLANLFAKAPGSRQKRKPLAAAKRVR